MTHALNGSVERNPASVNKLCMIPCRAPRILTNFLRYPLPGG